MGLNSYLVIWVEWKLDSLFWCVLKNDIPNLAVDPYGLEVLLTILFTDIVYKR